MNRMLGKAMPVHDDRTLMLASYMTHELPPHPTAIPVPDGINWGMLANDRAGDCTCAAIGHMVQYWSYVSKGQPHEVSDEEVLKLYSAVSGYDPATGANDDGAVVLNVLKYIKKNGFSGHKIDGFADCEPGNIDHQKAAIWHFGGVDTGMALPLTAQNQKVWSVPPRGPRGDGERYSWGGHSVMVAWYNLIGPVCITWGEVKQMTWEFWKVYCDESHAIVSEDWFNIYGRSATGLLLPELLADLQAVSK